MKLGEKMRDVTLSDVNGNPISIESYKGKKVLIYMWATW
jgi:peroxiredoxin